MLLHGSCHCGTIRFEVESRHPYPYNRCYCSVCRKTAGGGGFAINIGADSSSLKVTTAGTTAIYQAIINGETSPAERHFCQECASALWIYDRRWPDLIHPFASAIDSELPAAPQHCHMMLDSKAGWVEAEMKTHDQCFPEYPTESIEQWHQRMRLVR